MKIKQAALAGMMGLATVAPVKAQKPVQCIFETGFNGMIKKEMALYGGMNFAAAKNKNFADLFLGANLDANKNATFLGLFIDNYSWTKNVSSWVRGTLAVSKDAVNTTLEASPVRYNVSAGKFNFGINPAYTVYNDALANTTTQGVNTIFQSSYSMTPSDKLFLELRYSSTAAGSLKDIKFEEPNENNMFYMLSYQKTF